jgi:excinuclease ABC subunit C
METPKETLKNLPHSPGIYMFMSHTGELLYIGKAKDLKRRVSSYFQRDDAIGRKTSRLVSQIAKINTIQTASEFDALILEAKLIHDKLPKYNVVLKDDKSPLYILLTISEQLPRVLTIRRSDLPKQIHKTDALFGPFQSASMVRSLLRQLRHIIPYCTQKQRTGKPCFYSHLGLCNPCPSLIGADKDLIHQYRTNIYSLKGILSGKSTMVLKELETDMKKAATENKFEDAARLRDHIQHYHYMIQKQYDPMVYINSETGAQDLYRIELDTLYTILLPYIPKLAHIHRIECIDISNTAGTYATGSLTVLTDGIKDTSQYRRFRIRNRNSPNDVAMIEEVVRRRFSHPEWPLPDLLLVDGGKGQVTAAKKHTSVPVIGLAKRFEEVIIPYKHGWKTLRIPYTSSAIHMLERIRDEAHRIAHSYHRLLRSKSFV